MKGAKTLDKKSMINAVLERNPIGFLEAIVFGVISPAIKTSKVITIVDNADPAVSKDIESFFNRIVPEDESLYEHNSEGPDDMPAHIRSLLTNTSLSIPIINSKLVLGTWQGIYLYEHRNHDYVRKVIVNIMGE